MLRALVVLLVLVNAAYFAWSHGLLAAYGAAPASPSEPQRLTQQIKPEQMRILGVDGITQPQPQPLAPAPAGANATPAVAPASLATSAAAAPAVLDTAAAATQCLQAGVFTPKQAAALTTALLGALPAGSWVLESTLEPARWIVYMGRYASLEAAIKKRGELRGLGVASELVKGTPFTGGLAPGLSLGSFETEDQAAAELALMPRRGVKTAGIRLERPEQRGQRLKLPVVNAALLGSLESVKAQLEGKALVACV